MTDKKKKCLGLEITETEKGYWIEGPNLHRIFLGKNTYCDELTLARKAPVAVPEYSLPEFDCD